MRLLPVLLLVCLSSCSYVKPSDQVVIHDLAGNAAAQDTKVQADPTLPDWVKQYFQYEDQAWAGMDAWASRKTPNIVTPSTSTNILGWAGK